LLTAILVAAVSLSIQPPAIDMGDQHATWTEVYEAFQSKVPRLTPPTGRLGGVVFISALLVVGLILLFYRETPVSSG
jgi:hypothetical protein